MDIQGGIPVNLLIKLALASVHHVDNERPRCPVTIAVVAPTSTTNFPPEAIITGPPPNGKNDFSQPEVPIQLSAVILDEPENEAVTWSWTAYWGGGVRVPLYSYPIASGTASPPYGYNLPESQISYSWDPRNTICNDPDFSTTYRGAPNGVTLELTVTDPGGNSNGGAGPYRVTITLGCQAPTGAISVPFSTGPLQTITSGPISTIETATSPNIRSSKASITIRQSPY